MVDEFVRGTHLFGVCPTPNLFMTLQSDYLEGHLGA